MLAIRTRMTISFWLALAAIAGVMLTAGLVANPAGADPLDDTCRQVGNQLVWDLGEGPDVLKDEVNIRLFRADGTNAWLTTVQNTGQFEINNVELTHFLRYREVGTGSVNNVPCVLDRDGEIEVPRQDVGCRFNGSSLQWDVDPNGESIFRFNIRQGTPDGESTWVGTQAFGYFFLGETGGDYFIRYRETNDAGVTEVFNDVCTGGADLDTPAGQGFCRHDKSEVVWNSVDGIVDGQFNLRRVLADGSSRWVATTSGTQLFVDDIAAEYFVRYRLEMADGSVMVIDNNCS